MGKAFVKSTRRRRQLRSSVAVECVGCLCVVLFLALFVLIVIIVTSNINGSRSRMPSFAERVFDRLKGAAKKGRSIMSTESSSSFKKWCAKTHAFRDWCFCNNKAFCINKRIGIIGSALNCVLNILRAVVVKGFYCY